METRSLLPALVRASDGEDASKKVVCAPALGLVEGLAPVGSLLVPGAVAGYLRVLTRRYALVLPEGARGHLAHPRPGDRVEPVAYGAPLFDLVPASEASEGSNEVAADPEARAAVAASAGDKTNGLVAVRASTVGTFYRRPSPEAPPYVEVGAEIQPGTVVGLVEVMKVFNQVTYDGPGPATVRRILLDDGGEVQAGQTLLLLEPGANQGS